MGPIIAYALIALILTFLYAPVSFAKENIRLQLAFESVRLPEVEKALAELKTPCYTVKEFSPEWSRVVTEFFILCQALHIGGLDPIFEFKAYPSYPRILKQVRDGKILAGGSTFWNREGDPDLFYKTEEVLRVGEVELAIFTRPEHAALLKVRTLAELQKFTAVSSENWVVDWETLGDMGIKRFHATSGAQMFDMVQNKRADFTLDALSTLPDMSRVVNGVRLVPVPNIKVGLRGACSFLISKQFPESKKIYEALQIGLKDLRAKKRIKVRFVETGFYNPMAKDWHKLY